MQLGEVRENIRGESQRHHSLPFVVQDVINPADPFPHASLDPFDVALVERFSRLFHGLVGVLEIEAVLFGIVRGLDGHEPFGGWPSGVQVSDGEQNQPLLVERQAIRGLNKIIGLGHGEVLDWIGFHCYSFSYMFQIMVLFYSPPH